jgi:hypothetical protein
MAWVFSGSLDMMPTRIRPPPEERRDLTVMTAIKADSSDKAKAFYLF